MNTSTEQAASSHRRKHQWMGAATLLALCALILPWLLTPNFEAIQSSGPVLTPLPEPPAIGVAPSVDVTPPSPADAEKLDALLNAPMTESQTPSFVLQVGAFKSRENAQAMADRVTFLDVGRAYIRIDGEYSRVYVGPYLNRAAAESAQQAIATQLSVSPQIKPYDVREDGQS